MIGFITVRTSSTRLPKKCLLSFGESTVLNHIIRRTVSYDIEPIVCTSTSKEDDIIEEIANKEGVKCYRGPLDNKLQRWLDCAMHFNIDIFHTIDADDPFFDGNEMKSSMRMLQEEKLDMVEPTESSATGGASVGYSLTTDIVKRVCRGLDKDTDTEMMWYYIEKVSNLKTKILPETRKNITKMRLTLDYEEDYWLLDSVRRILGNLTSRDEVGQLFLSNPDMYKINWFRNEEWQSAQVSKKI
jgi:spore coat polysaccharide biosynthesis protein SpsF (cytidylyltransferase family)